MTDPKVIKFINVLDSHGLEQQVWTFSSHVVICAFVWLSLIYQLFVIILSLKLIFQYCKISPQSVVLNVEHDALWFNLDRLVEDIVQSSLVHDSTDEDNVIDLFDRYNNAHALRSLLDVHATARTMFVRAAWSAP